MGNLFDKVLLLMTINKILINEKLSFKKTSTNNLNIIGTCLFTNFIRYRVIIVLAFYVKC